MSIGSRGAFEAVFFDVGGTLLRARPSVGHVYAEVLQPFGRTLAPEVLDPHFQAAWARESARLPAGRDRFSEQPEGARGFWRRLLDEMLSAAGEAPALRDDEFEAVYTAFRSSSRYMLFADVLPVLEALAAREVRMGVISNWDERLPPLLEELGLGAYFPVIVTSGIERLEKPSPRMFHLACERAGVAVAKALHVGDSLREDYQGAKAAGLAGLLLDRTRGESGEDVIHSLAGVLDRMDRGLRQEAAALAQGGSDE